MASHRPAARALVVSAVDLLGREREAPDGALEDCGRLHFLFFCGGGGGGGGGLREVGLRFAGDYPDLAGGTCWVRVGLCGDMCVGSVGGDDGSRLLFFSLSFFIFLQNVYCV